MKMMLYVCGLSAALSSFGQAKEPLHLNLTPERRIVDGVSVTTIGLGDDYNEELMSGLAEASDANNNSSWNVSNRFSTKASLIRWPGM